MEKIRERKEAMREKSIRKNSSRRELGIVGEN
jgi:hypothetical protein